MKIAIVDDMEIWQNAASDLIRKQLGEKAEEIEVFPNGEVFNYEKEYDMIFLDVEMPGIDGFEVAARYRENYDNAIIIFLTTHQELGRKGYMVNAFRYIDKEHMEDELSEALHSVELLQQRNQMIPFHVVNLGEVPIEIKKIIYIETQKRNVVIHTKDRDYISSHTIESLESKLQDFGFFRSHKSFLVSLDNIREFNHQNVYFRNGDTALVSDRRYSQLKEKYIERKFEIANS